jgi:hypothetical protein
VSKGSLKGLRGPGIVREIMEGSKRFWKGVRGPGRVQGVQRVRGVLEDSEKVLED